jgi:hypothetical protein
MSNEALIRFGFFAGVFAIVAILEVLAPRRAKAASKSRRWLSNLTLIALNPLSVRLLFPVLPVGMALIASEHNWGLLNNLVDSTVGNQPQMGSGVPFSKKPVVIFENNRFTQIFYRGQLLLGKLFERLNFFNQFLIDCHGSLLPYRFLCKLTGRIENFRRLSSPVLGWTIVGV